MKNILVSLVAAMMAITSTSEVVAQESPAVGVPHEFGEVTRRGLNENFDFLVRELAALREQLELAAGANTELTAEINNLRETVGSLSQQAVPPSAVIPFNFAACPVGWNDFGEGAGRMIIGVGNGSGLSVRTLLETGGTEEYALTPSELPSHRIAIATQDTTTKSMGDFIGPPAVTRSEHAKMLVRRLS